MKKIKVLFLCTGNSARSQMAESFLRQAAGDRFDVYSAGLEPKGINPLATRVMEEIGIDLTGHSSKNLSEFLGVSDFNYIITLCDNANSRCPFFPGAGIRLHWPFEDPALFEGSEDQKLDKFREIRDQIRSQIDLWVSECLDKIEQ